MGPGNNINTISNTRLDFEGVGESPSTLYGSPCVGTFNFIDYSEVLIFSL